MWGGRGSDAYPMISQPTDGGRIVKQPPNSQLLLVNLFTFSQFQIKRAHFSLAFTTYDIFCKQIVDFFKPFQQTNILSHLRNSYHVLSSSFSTAS